MAVPYVRLRTADYEAYEGSEFDRDCVILRGDGPSWTNLAEFGRDFLLQQTKFNSGVVYYHPWMGSCTHH
jgi:hypothetical protein